MILHAIKHFTLSVLAIPLFLGVMLSILYLFSWVLLFPIVLPLMYYQDYGTPFWKSFLIINGIGLTAWIPAAVSEGLFTIHFGREVQEAASWGMFYCGVLIVLCMMLTLT